MTDLSKLSDDELMTLYQQGKQQRDTGFVAPPLIAPDKIAQRAIFTDANKRIGEQRDALNQSYQDRQALERFHALNTTRATGGIQSQSYDGWERANPLNWPGMLGNMAEKYNPAYQEMSGIASNLQGKQRPPGSGATSDYEQRLYRQGVPSPEKAGPVNDSIINYMNSVRQEESDRLAFQEEFLRRNGSLSGAQQAWARYISANPYASVNKQGLTEPNANRKDWKGYFGLQPQSGAAPASRGGPPPTKAQTVNINGVKVTVRPK